MTLHSEQANIAQTRLPRSVTIAVCLLTFCPLVLGWLGVNLGGSPAVAVGASPVAGATVETRLDSFAPILHDLTSHFLLEWSAFCIALVTVVFAFVHYQVKNDVTTPIIGAALFFPAMIDAFCVLAEAQFFDASTEMVRFVPAVWCLSRGFTASIMIAGAFLVMAPGRPASASRNARGAWVGLSLAVLYAALAYLMVVGAARWAKIPVMIYPESLLPRPWDTIPLIMLLVAGIVLPRFYRRNPSLFSHALALSVVPHIVAQAHAAFGSRALWDHHFNSASLLKLLAYCVPLLGLLLDYVRVTWAEEALRATEIELRVAREVQRDLLPSQAPDWPGFDLAGVSYPAVAVGGDYFDFVSLTRRQELIVVADVSGHDIGASIFMAQTRAYLRALAQTYEALDELCRQLNACLLTDSKDRRFVTMFLVRLDPRTSEMEFAGAGHSGYLVDAAGEVHVLQAEGIPLGVMDDGEWSSGPVRTLRPGDVIVLLTDGVLEAETPDGVQFGLTRAMSVVAAHRHRTAREIVTTLHDSVRQYCGNAAPADDITIVVLKKTDTP